jgi:four helix bundle protein
MSKPAPFTRFEDIAAWQRSRALTCALYTLTAEDGCRTDFALRDQLRRAGISVMSNIAEGFERDGNREFIQFLSIAKGSLGEVRCQLYVAFDAGYITEQRLNGLVRETQEIRAMLHGLIIHLEKSARRGSKYDRRGY